MGNARDAFYFSAVFALLVLGVAAIFSFGLPLLILAVVLIVSARHRGDRARFWPPVVGALTFLSAAALIAPSRCTRTEGVHSASTECTSLIGYHYAGGGHLGVALIASLVVAVLAAGIARWRLRA